MNRSILVRRRSGALIVKANFSYKSAWRDIWLSIRKKSHSNVLTVRANLLWKATSHVIYGDILVRSRSTVKANFLIGLPWRNIYVSIRERSHSNVLKRLTWWTICAIKLEKKHSTAHIVKWNSPHVLVWCIICVSIPKTSLTSARTVRRHSVRVRICGGMRRLIIGHERQHDTQGRDHTNPIDQLICISICIFFNTACFCWHGIVYRQRNKNILSNLYLSHNFTITHYSYSSGY